MIELPSKLKNNMVYYWKVEAFCSDNEDLAIVRKQESVKSEIMNNEGTRTIESQIWTFKTN